METIKPGKYIELAYEVYEVEKKEEAAEKAVRYIEAVAAEGDSVGGILETAIVGLPEGLGEPWFDSVESVLSHALFSIPAIKGVEFGAGFSCADMLGSYMNDNFVLEDNKITTKTNNNGGINGGITNGMPVIFRCAVKPTPSIFVAQPTVNLKTKENVMLSIKGRHDPCIVPRALPAVEAAVAIAVTMLLAEDEKL